jgi:hypothetical protein
VLTNNQRGLEERKRATQTIQKSMVAWRMVSPNLKFDVLHKETAHEPSRRIRHIFNKQGSMEF